MAGLVTKDSMISPAPSSVWQHRNGNLYTVICLANTDGDDPARREKYPPTVVYCGENGKVWARRLDDWHRSMEFVIDYSPTIEGHSILASLAMDRRPFSDPDDEARL